MKTAEIRSRFLNFFKSKQHTIVESSSLVPANDPTLLFTNAGMVQFKDVFTGKETRPYKRAASSQKCVRAGGKHNDLENVGFTARHHTFFEMLGNFSFGDYFKEDAIQFAWEFITKELKLPVERLYATVYTTDDEAFDIWHKKIGLPKEKIYRFGEKDNFWAMGDTGPCGPCSEIFIDRGEQYGCNKPTCAMGCDCDRYLEFWNLVFMQYERAVDGKLTPLPKPSVDTGAGLERVAMIMQNADTNYDIDLFQDIIRKIGELFNRTYQKGTEDAFFFRVIADHSRAITFLISDGVLPANEGRGYVLRRIIRRAVRYGRKLGATGPFLYKTCQFVIDQMQDAYPDLKDKRALIEKLVFAEEEQFLKTLERGLALLDEEIGKVKKGGVLSGEVAFKMYDTYGFPADLTRIICAEQGISVDEEGFEQAMSQQRLQSRKNWKGSGEQGISQVYHDLSNKLKAAKQTTQFLGYDHMEAKGQVLGLIANNQLVDMYAASTSEDIVEAVFDKTPFYAESGGQVGDHGRITGDGLVADVIDVQKPVGDLVVVQLKPREGRIRVGGTYLQETDRELRELTKRNHTATHMLHWALRDVLGDHVKQAGSLVNADQLRFDFAHFQALTPEELKRVEDLINERIWESHAVVKKEMAKDEAIAAGAIAFFGEKYGDTVRVVRVGQFSTELCGGTHVDNTAEINLFKIVNESSIASGVRRIIAYTSKGAFQYLQEKDAEYRQVRDRFKAVSLVDLEQKIDKMQAAEKDLRRQLEKFAQAAAGQEMTELLQKAKSLKDVKFMATVCATDPSGMKKLRDMAEQLRQKDSHAVVVLGMADPAENKTYLVAAAGKDVMGKVPAGKIIQELAPMMAGRGGGKPDLAQAGGTDIAGLQKAIAAAEGLVERLLG